MINVCHVLTMTTRGGVETMLCDHLAEQEDGFRHYVITTSSDPVLLRGLNNVETFEPKRLWRFDSRAITQMAAWMKEKHIDIVHGYNATGNTYGGLAARLAGVRHFVAGERGTINHMRCWRRPGDRWAQRSADHVIANSRSSSLLVKQFYGIPDEKITVVHNAVPEAAPVVENMREQLNVPEGPLIGAVGRLHPMKGFDVFLKTAGLLQKQRPDLVFLLVGGGPEEAFLKAIHETLPDPARVLMTGWRPDARAIMPHLDILVSTSIDEPLGNVLLEAGQAAVPVVAPAVGGIPEVVLNGRTGLLLEPGEELTRPCGACRKVVVNGKIERARALAPEKLSEGILELLENPARLQEYGETARDHILRNYSIHRYRADLRRVYESLVQR